LWKKKVQTLKIFSKTLVFLGLNLFGESFS